MRGLRVLVPVLGSVLLASSLAAGASRPKVKVKEINFADGTLDGEWTGVPVNLRAESGKGLALGIVGQPTAATGHIQAEFPESVSDPAPQPDVTAEAVVDLRNLATAWATRSVSIRVQRDADPNKVVVARVTAWIPDRFAATPTTKVRLTVGAKINVGGTYKWVYVVSEPPNQEVPDNTTQGTLVLRLVGKTVEAEYGGVVLPHTAALDDAGTYTSLVRLELQGDPALVEPVVESFDAKSPP